MNFLKDIQNSIYAPEFYKEIPKKSLWQAIKYFLVLVLLITFVSLAFLFQTLVIKTPAEIQDLVQNTINCFPNDLEVKISQGVVSTNAKEPYFIATCQEDKNNLKADYKFAVIDTKTPFSQSKFEEYKTYVWLTKDSLVVKDKEYQTRLYSLTQVKELTVNKTSINTFYSKVSPYLKWLGVVFLLFAFLGIVIFHIFRLIQLFITAALIWLLAKIFKVDLGYGTAYKLGLFACTLGIIAEFIISYTAKWTNFYGFPFMFTILTLGVVTINYFLTKKSKS